MRTARQTRWRKSPPRNRWIGPAGWPWGSITWWRILTSTAWPTTTAEWEATFTSGSGAGVILGCSLLTARGIPCSGEADLKNCQAMKIMDLLGAGGSYTELYAMDFRERFILMGHDGPFHLGIAEGRPILRGLGLYHGKSGFGVSVEASVRKGPITILGAHPNLRWPAEISRGGGRMPRR